MQKRIASIVLFFCLVAPAVTTFSILQFQKSQTRKEIKHQIITGIDKNELVLIKLSTAEVLTQLEWEHATEFEYRNEMYDVVETEVIGDTTYYWCWWDNKETALNKQLDELLAGIMDNNPTQKENNKKLISFYKSLYCSDIEPIVFLPYSENRNLVAANSNLVAIYSPPTTPPPQIG